MAKRRTAKKPAPKKKIKLETLFTCPFCSNGESVECHIDTEVWIAKATCYICKESYATKATPLTEPIDVYHEWIDECERVNNA